MKASGPASPINAMGCGFKSTAELIGGTQHDLADKLFCRPAIGHELRSQVIEQLWIGWFGTARAKVIGCFDQTTPE